MFSRNQNLNPIARLYPNLVIRKVEAPSIRSLSQERSKTPIEQPKPILKPAPKPTETVSREKSPEKVIEKLPEVIPEPKVEKKKRVKVTEPIEKVIEEPKPEPKPDPKPEPKPEPKRARPNRASGRVRDMLKGEPTQRESVVPQLGESGFKPKYTPEQRQAQYLERLSRKSVKNAEKEVAQVLEVLDSVGHDPAKLKEEERLVKKRLSLINTAKYFTTSNNIQKQDEKALSEKPEVESKTEGVANNPTSNRDIRRKEIHREDDSDESRESDSSSSSDPDSE